MRIVILSEAKDLGPNVVQHRRRQPKLNPGTARAPSTYPRSHGISNVGGLA